MLKTIHEYGFKNNIYVSNLSNDSHEREKHAFFFNACFSLLCGRGPSPHTHERKKACIYIIMCNFSKNACACFLSLVWMRPKKWKMLNFLIFLIYVKEVPTLCSPEKKEIFYVEYETTQLISSRSRV